jgi:hypothetical protein
MRLKLLILALACAGVVQAQTPPGGYGPNPGGNSSGGGSTPNSTTVPGIYAASAPYNALFNGRTAQDGVLNGTTLVTSASLTCNPAAVSSGGDIGKTIFTTTSNGLSSKANSTVASCSGANFVMASIASASESGDNLVVCSDDTVALQTAWTAALAANIPLFLPTGLSCISALPFKVPNLTAAQQPQQTVVISGAGMNATVLGMVPSYNFTGAVNGTVFDDGIAQSCVFQPSAQQVFTVSTLQDFSVTGFTAAFTGWPAGVAVLGTKACQVHRVGIFTINAPANVPAISAPQESYIDNNNIQKFFAGPGILMTGGGTTALGNIVAFATGATGVGYSVLNCTSECAIVGGFTTSIGSVGIKVVNSVLSLVDLQISTGSGNTGITVDATSTVNAARNVLIQSGVSTSVGFNVASGGKLNLSQLNYQPSGTPTEIINAGTVFDSCGNNFSGSITNTGSWFKSCSITGTAQIAGNIVPSVCGTTTVGTVSGAGGDGQFTLTFGGAPGTSCTVTVTYPNAFPASTVPLCAFSDVGGTNAFPTSIVNGAVSATSAAFTETATAFTNGNTEIVQYTCRLP